MGNCEEAAIPSTGTGVWGGVAGGGGGGVDAGGSFGEAGN